MDRVGVDRRDGSVSGVIFRIRSESEIAGKPNRYAAIALKDALIGGGRGGLLARF
jgi:hypothetical protein